MKKLIFVALVLSLSIPALAHGGAVEVTEAGMEAAIAQAMAGVTVAVPTRAYVDLAPPKRPPEQVPSLSAST